MPRTPLALSVLLLLVACSGGAAPEPASVSSLPAPTGDDLADMRAAIAALQARPEQPDEDIEIQHVLVAFQGAERATVKRSKEDAEKMAAVVLARARKGDNFTSLMQQYSTDTGPGTYPMTKARRTEMVKGFGDVGFRLRVGEVGVAPYDPVDSPFGWHVIKRLK